MTDKRSGGVLLPLSSLNGDYAVGVMGEEAREFILKLRRMGFSCWQVLPLGTTDQMNSPYCSCSAFAGNYIYIDPRELMKAGLITEAEAKENLYGGSPYTADYSFANEKRLALLKKAFSRLDENEIKKVENFAEENSFCEDFSYYMALKESHGFAPWWEWEDKYKYRSSAEKYKADFSEKILFYNFTQYEFFRQWGMLKAFANDNGISIMGDMPIYVSLDSADVWSNTDLFRINKETLKPEKVAGVPPDYFSSDGQLWGNPIYDWDEMEKTGYRWWIDRIKHAFKMYDTVRIDHFRAFASYWAVEYGAETAKEGEWEKGPGMKLFSAIEKAIGKPSIVAEDLGTFGEDVVKLLEDTAFPGMRVIQFGFDPDGDSTHLPHNYTKNCVAYIGTHDNNTILGWLYDASPREREFALDYCGFKGNNWGDGGYRSESCRSVTEAVWKSPAYLSVIAFQDMCGFGNDARMNKPGIAEKNWLYRAGKDAMQNVDESYFAKINKIYKRF